MKRWTRSKLLWVHRKLAKKEELLPQVRQPEFVSGECFTYLGRSYRLQVVAEHERPLHFDGRRFLLRKDAVPRATEYFRSWFISVGKTWIEERIEFLAGQVRRFTISHRGSRSGLSLGLVRQESSCVFQLENAPVARTSGRLRHCPRIGAPHRTSSWPRVLATARPVAARLARTPKGTAGQSGGDLLVWSADGALARRASNSLWKKWSLIV